MLINTKQLKDDLNFYNELLKEYEDNYLNYYNVISLFSFFWNDAHSKKFYTGIPKEKDYCKNILFELNSISEIYKYLYIKYSQLGELIYVDLKNEDIVMLKFDKYIEEANSLVYKFNNLDLSFCVELKPLIGKQQKKLVKNIDTMRENREKVKKHFEQVRIIEQTVKNKLKNLDFTLIKETDISGML